jgi:hypothetical protein
MFGIRKTSYKNLSTNPLRCFGGGHHYDRPGFYSKSQHTIFKRPVEEGDIQQEFGNNDMFYNRIVAKLVGHLRPHRITDLDNSRTNKYSAYYWFPKIAFFRNSMFLKTMSNIFETNRNRNSSVYDEPVQIHENSVFLYKAMQGSFFLSTRLQDYAALSLLIYGTFISNFPLMWLPCVVYAMDVPRFLNQTSMFVIRADLIPHTEQVVFTKATMFGNIARSIVDIKNLNKISHEDVVGGDSLFKYSSVDNEFVWKCSETQEIFIFDARGIWSEEGINHPLIN